MENSDKQTIDQSTVSISPEENSFEEKPYDNGRKDGISTDQEINLQVVKEGRSVSQNENKEDEIGKISEQDLGEKFSRVVQNYDQVYGDVIINYGGISSHKFSYFSHQPDWEGLFPKKDSAFFEEIVDALLVKRVVILFESVSDMGMPIAWKISQFSPFHAMNPKMAIGTKGRYQSFNHFIKELEVFDGNKQDQFLVIHIKAFESPLDALNNLAKDLSDLGFVSDCIEQCKKRRIYLVIVINQATAAIAEERRINCMSIIFHRVKLDFCSLFLDDQGHHLFVEDIPKKLYSQYNLGLWKDFVNFCSLVKRLAKEGSERLKFEIERIQIEAEESVNRNEVVFSTVIHKVTIFVAVNFPDCPISDFYHLVKFLLEKVTPPAINPEKIQPDASSKWELDADKYLKECQLVSKVVIGQNGLKSERLVGFESEVDGANFLQVLSENYSAFVNQLQEVLFANILFLLPEASGDFRELLLIFYAESSRRNFNKFGNQLFVELVVSSDGNSRDADDLDLFENGQVGIAESLLFQLMNKWMELPEGAVFVTEKLNSFLFWHSNLRSYLEVLTILHFRKVVKGIPILLRILDEVASYGQTNRNSGFGRYFGISLTFMIKSDRDGLAENLQQINSWIGIHYRDLPRVPTKVEWVVQPFMGMLIGELNGLRIGAKGPLLCENIGHDGQDLPNCAKLYLSILYCPAADSTLKSLFSGASHGVLQHFIDSIRLDYILHWLSNSGSNEIELGNLAKSMSQILVDVLGRPGIRSFQYLLTEKINQINSQILAEKNMPHHYGIKSGGEIERLKLLRSTSHGLRNSIRETIQVIK